MAPFIAGLLKAGLSLAANAALAKGKEYLEEKAGIKIDEAKPPTEAELVAVKQAEMEHEEEMARLRVEDNKLDAEIQRMYLADVQSARARDVEYVKAGKNNTRGDVLAYSAIGALIACLLLLFVFKVPAESRDLLLVVLGALVAIVKDVFSFEFGSSKDSARNAQAVVDVLRNGSGS